MLTLAELLAVLKCSRATLYRRVSSGDFPAPVKFGERSNRWPQSEVEAWIENRPRAALRS